jgi:hypothetical protein
LPFIFHQNMRDFGGAAAKRNVFFNMNLGFVGASVMLHAPFVAAGFTEITNAGASRATLTALAAVLSGAMTNVLVIVVGTMALSKKPEYIGIAWDPGVITVHHAGHALYDVYNGRWQAFNYTDGALANALANQRILFPNNNILLALRADTRGIAYIAGTVGGNPKIIAFMHNMYAIGDPTGGFNNVPTMAERARQSAGGIYAGAQIIVGGDFNIRPRNPKRPRGNQLALLARWAGNPPTNTTNANPYDFWLVSNGVIAHANASVYPATRFTPGGSDHAGIGLNAI